MGLTRAQRMIEWIEDNLYIPEGMDVGKPFILRDFQKNDLIKIYDNPSGTRRAIVSRPKKTAKTTLGAALLLGHLCGPESRQNSNLYSSALSRDQAALTFDAAQKMVNLSEKLEPFILIRDSAKEIVCPELGTKYKALSAESSTNQGKSPVFVLHDELGQVRGPTFDMYYALESAFSAHVGGLSIVLSTQAETDADLLSVLIDDALDAVDPKVVIILSVADDIDDPDILYSEELIKSVNPAYGDFYNKEEALQFASDARRMPQQEAFFRNFVLNQRVSTRSSFISESVWKDNAGPIARDWSDFVLWGGLDLSSTVDLTSCTWIAWDRKLKKWHIKPVFWMPEDMVQIRQRRDRAPYDVWVKKGLLLTTPGKSIKYSFVAEYIWNTYQRFNVKKIGYDRWAYNHFRNSLEDKGFNEQQLDPTDENSVFVPFGQGYQSMSPALKTLQVDLFNGDMLHEGHPVLNMCRHNAVTVPDDAENIKLTKKKSSGRIDGMITLAMARGIAEGHIEKRPEESIYETRGMVSV